MEKPIIENEIKPGRQHHSAENRDLIWWKAYRKPRYQSFDLLSDNIIQPIADVIHCAINDGVMSVNPDFNDEEELLYIESTFIVPSSPIVQENAPKRKYSSQIIL